MCYICMSFLWNPPEKVVPAQKEKCNDGHCYDHHDHAAMYLAAWSLHSHDKMSGIAPSILAAMAAMAILLELTIYMVVLLPVLPWTISAVVFTATATLFVTCALVRANEQNKLLRDKSR